MNVSEELSGKRIGGKSEKASIKGIREAEKKKRGKS